MRKTIELEIETIMYSIDEERKELQFYSQIAEKLIDQIINEIEKFSEISYSDFRVLIKDNYSCRYDSCDVELLKLVVELKALEKEYVRFTDVSIYFDAKVIELELG